MFSIRFYEDLFEEEEAKVSGRELVNNSVRAPKHLFGRVTNSPQKPRKLHPSSRKESEESEVQAEEVEVFKKDEVTN